MTDGSETGLGPVEAAWLVCRIVEMTKPDRKALRLACAAKCPPGKNKRQAQSEPVRQAA